MAASGEPLALLVDVEQAKSLISISSCGPAGCRTHFKKAGHFHRKWDRARIQRYRCLKCGRFFSDSTDTLCFRQQKPDLNSSVLHLICSSTALRRIALILRVNRKTAVRKGNFLAKMGAEYLKNLSQTYGPFQEIQFDDMETHEHSKWKPLSITIAVSQKRKKRLILGVQVSQMPAKGKLAALARKKYGPRKDQRAQGRARLFQDLKPLVCDDAIIRSDQNPHYVEDVRKHFPSCTHKTHKGRRGCIVGQGELKRGGYDVLFTLNHTFAMIRDNLKRLGRRTWCTTKKAERLQGQLGIYALYHNEFLLKKKTGPKIRLVKAAQLGSA